LVASVFLAKQSGETVKRRCWSGFSSLLHGAFALEARSGETPRWMPRFTVSPDCWQGNW
jgi:hypothetical protein